MHAYALSQLSDAALIRDLAALAVQDRRTTALFLAHIAEVDARRLYAPAGYPSMHAYCVDVLRLSDDAAFKRILAARAAREFPQLFTAVAEGRLHLTAVCRLAPHLTAENVEELIAAATHRRKVEIEDFLARRFPPETLVFEARAISAHLQVPEPVGELLALPSVVAEATTAAAPTFAAAGPGTAAPEQAVPVAPPIERLVGLSVRKATMEKIEYARALLSHAVPSADVSQVLDRALDLLIAKVEARKFGGGASRARRRVRPVGDAWPTVLNTPPRSRYVPAHVRRAVWERDDGQCTFVSESGHRCEARRFLEFDHVDPVARGGRATVEGMRLRCRTHNQYEAERTFGAEFMSRKRREARLAVVAAAPRGPTIDK